MKRTSIDKAALLGSASALGLNWIYDKELLRQHKQEGHPMIFEAIDHDLYARAKNAYDVYPDHQVGDLDFLGEVYYVTHMFLHYEKNHSLERYREVLFEYFREDYEYNGYVESYGKDFLKRYREEQEGKRDVALHTDHIDKQMVGLVFLFAVYEHDFLLNKEAAALDFARVLTAYPPINELTQSLYYLLTLLDDGVPLRQALPQLDPYLPDSYRDDILASLKDIDLDPFVQQHAGIACGIEHALPLVFYILLNTTTWEEAMVLNATLGGASSARGMFVSAIASRYLEIPKQYLDQLNYHID
jgi:hypothetical protein